MSASRFASMLAGTLGLLIAASAWLFGGGRGFADLAVYTATLVPGLPLGLWLFGRRHVAGWIAGALAGYAISTLAFTLVIKLGLAGIASPAAFVIAWALLIVILFRVTPRPREPLVPMPVWTSRDAAAWLLVLHLVPLLITVPLAHVGSRDAQGSKQYRAYFIADFVWHMALTQEVARFEQPPHNPYMFDKPIHYYWTYFVTPAVMSPGDHAPVERVELALKTCAFGTALLMFSTIFLAALAVARRAWIAATAAALALIGPSPEGVSALISYWRDAVPLALLRNTNIDYMVGFAPWHGLRIDGLLRSMLYTPQHSLSFALGLVAVVAGISVTTPLSLAGRLVTGTLLGLSVIINPFLGAAFVLIYAVAMLGDVVAHRRGWTALAGHFVSGLPVALGLAWCFWTKMAGGVGERLSVGPFPEIGPHPVGAFAMSLGTLVIPAAFGLIPFKRVPWRPFLPAIAAFVLGVALMHGVSLTDRYWVGFRAGNILQVTLPMLVARGLLGFAESGFAWIGASIVAVAMIAGAPTTLIDAYNAQDVANRETGPGFTWTDVLTPAQQAGLNWIRRNTPSDAVVQAHRLPDLEYLDRQDWSIIQSMAGRRSAAANFVSLLPEPENDARVAAIHALFTSDTPEAAHATARALGIQYLWLDQQDAFRTAFLERIVTRKDLFYAVFQEADVYVIKVG
jgi:hypothetical protein